MSSAEHLRRAARVVVAGVVAIAAGLVAAPSASADEVYPRPAGTTIDFLGHGWGHGNGMSQYGSLGGAQAGKTWQQILAHYYTGTTLGSIGSPTIRVRVASLGSSVQAYPATGLRVTWDLTNSSVLPATRDGVTIARWRIVPGAKVAGTKTKFVLQYLPSGSSTWKAYATTSVPSTGAFLNPTSGTVTTLRSSTKVVYRGQVRGTLIGSAGAESLVPVVALPLESYLLSVVPSESPASWPAAALSAQAVAARSFAEYHRRYLPISKAWYDVYDDTRSQVFPAPRSGASRRSTPRRPLPSTPRPSRRCSTTGRSSTRSSAPRAGATPTPAASPTSRPCRTRGTPWRATPTTRGRRPWPSRPSRRRTRASGGSRPCASPRGPGWATRAAGCSASRSRARRPRWRPRAPASRRRSASSTTGSRPNPGSSPSYPRDVTGDGHADVVAVEASGGALRVYPTTGTGAWKTPIRSGSGWTGYAKVLTAGTWDGDPISDVIVQDKAGGLFLRSGNGNGTFAASVRIGSGWTVHDLVMPVGDFDGDGLTDLVARRADGVLFLYSGNGRGGFASGAGRQIGAGWDTFTAVFSPGDFSGDGLPDLLARAADGTVYLYRGNGVGGWLLPRATVGTGWQQYTALTSPGDFTGDGRADVLARTADSTLYVIPGDGHGAFTARAKVGAGWNIFSRILL